jgi:hypothetical protein
LEDSDLIPLLWFRLDWRDWGEFQRDFSTVFLPPEYQKRLREEVRLRIQGDSGYLRGKSVNLDGRKDWIVSMRT